MENSKTVTFSLGGMIFEYDEKKNKINIEKHGISFKSAARVFFDTERIRKNENGAEIDVTRLISARYATNFERGLYYGKY